MKEYKWATLGCGVIANQLAQAFAANGRKLYSVANRTHEKAVAFAEKYGIDKVYDQIDDVFSDDEVDIIYISTPQNMYSVKNPLPSTLKNWKKRFISLKNIM